MQRLFILFVMIVALVGAADKKVRPKGPRTQAVITLRIVEASSAAAANDAADLVPQELKGLLRYTRYHLLDTAVLRGAEGEELTLAIAGDLRADAEFTLRGTPQQPVLDYSVQIRRQRDGTASGERLMDTRVSGQNGETIVLGASRMNLKESAKALIVLLTGKLIP